uniref:Uncharacterized protein n=1 Tax=Brassica oleracea var. oleracea TaxID=109376 RepID=A0A0D3CXE4_BRAOL
MRLKNRTGVTIKEDTGEIDMPEDTGEIDMPEEWWQERSEIPDALRIKKHPLVCLDLMESVFRNCRVSDEPCFISYPRDDRSDQVAESSLLRVETHVVDDVFDYDIASVNPPNDEYVSDVEPRLTTKFRGFAEKGFIFRFSSSLAVSNSKPRRLRLNLTPLKMNSTIVPGTHDASPHMPPGATGPALNHAGSLPMPPGATGPALNHTASSSRSNSYTQMTLNAMLNSPTRLAQPHLHPDKLNGALWFGIDPSINAFIRATWQGYYMGPWKSWRKVPEERKDSWWQTFVTHSRPDGTFVDYRAEELVTQAEMEATQLSNTEGSPGSPSASSAPSRLMLNKAYLKNAKSKRGYVYGLGSEQYREHAPSSCVPNGLARNLELEMRVGGLETSLQNVTADVAGVKQDVAGVKQDVSDMRQEFAATREAINQVLQTLRPPQAPTGQTSDQP